MAAYYVRPTSGSDSNDGLSFANAFATTAKAASVVAAGDTVKLCAEATEAPAGTATIAIATAGTSGPAGIIMWLGCDASGDELASGSYYTISGAGMNAGTDLINLTATYNSFRHVKLSGGKRFCAYHSSDPGSRTILTDCWITGAGTALFGAAAGISMNERMFACRCDSSPLAFSGISGRVVPISFGCTFTNLSTGLASKDPISPTMYNCVIIGGSLPGTNSGTGVFDHCTFYGCTEAIGLQDRTATARDGVVSNCSFVNCTYGIRPFSDQATVGTSFNGFNHFYNNGTDYTGGVSAGPGDIAGDPLFNDAANGDFRLKAGSPLIGAGAGGSNIGAMAAMASGGGIRPISHNGGYNS